MNATTARKLAASGATVSALDEPARIIGAQRVDSHLWIKVAYLDDITPNQWLQARFVREI